MNEIIPNMTATSVNHSFRSYEDEFNYDEEEYIFDNILIRIIFISIYSIVFCLCFFGNLLVIIVVTMSRRLRSITNFFLANLAVADFCVGVFCVLQNLSIYLITDWVLGDFLCKMYQFVNSLSYTASIFILVVICSERYFAIIHPITCKQILTARRLRFICYKAISTKQIKQEPTVATLYSAGKLNFKFGTTWIVLRLERLQSSALVMKLAIFAVWCTSALYSAPKFFWVNTITTYIGNKSETVCIANRKKFNSQIFDTINFIFLYIIPLAIMTILYTRIAVGLWTSSKKLEKQLNACTTNQYQDLSRKQSVRSKDANKHGSLGNESKTLCNTGNISNSSQNVLKARRGVIRMLIVVVLTFALCNLPFHARKMWQYWSSHYHGDTDFSALFTPLTFLVTYFNSGINPLLYAFLSKNFRRGMREVLFCTIFGNKKDENHQLFHRSGYHNNYPTSRSTMKGQAATTTVTIINAEGSSECSHEV